MNIIPLIKLTSPRLITEEMIGLLARSSLKAELVGSFQRSKEATGDAEIAAISQPKFLSLTDELVTQKVIEKALAGRWDDQCREMIYQDVQIKLFLTDQDNYGYQLWLRNGTVEANAVITDWISKHGAPLQLKDYIHWRSQRLAVRSEREVFDLFGMRYIPPDCRTESVYRHQLKKWWGGWPDFSGYVIDAPMQLRLF